MQVNTAVVSLVVSVVIFVIGVTFAAGRLSARVDALELWRGDVKRDIDGIFTSVRNLEKLIRGEEV